MGTFANEVRHVLTFITYKDWHFEVIEKGDNVFLQIQFFADGKMQYCRMWYLWDGMGVTGIVKAAWGAVKAAEEHEAAEAFRYRGVKVFNPHLDIDVFVEDARWKRNIAVTEDPH